MLPDYPKVILPNQKKQIAVNILDKQNTNISANVLVEDLLRILNLSKGLDELEEDDEVRAILPLMLKILPEIIQQWLSEDHLPIVMENVHHTYITSVCMCAAFILGATLESRELTIDLEEEAIDMEKLNYLEEASTVREALALAAQNDIPAEDIIQSMKKEGILTNKELISEIESELDTELDQDSEEE